MIDTNYKKVQLVFPSGGSKLSSTGVIPPIGIIQLGSYLKSKNPNLDIEVIDGETISQKEIIEKLNGDILGLSITGANYLNSMEIAKYAKQKGVQVVVGGPHSTINHKKILKENSEVDYAIRRDGEQAFYKLLTNTPLEKIKNLTFRNDKEIKANELETICEQINLNQIPNLNYNLLTNSEEYEKNFKNHIYNSQGFTKFVGMESQKGCPKGNAKNTKRCSFCARIDKGLRRLSPEKFWENVENVYDPNGKTMIWDFSDSFTGKPNKEDSWLKQVRDFQPKELKDKVYFKIFARADELDKKTTKIIKELNVKEVFIGIESGDQEKLDSVNKRLKVEDSIYAVKNLKDVGIKTYASFIYGFPNEDSESLQKTIFHMEKIMKAGIIDSVGVRCMFPMPGMKIYKDLERKLGKLPKDTRELQKLWIQNMTNTSIEEIQKYHKQAIKIANKNNVRINDGKRLLLG
ncbi:B12-binding domain-containing radical SAM protein [Candidatus Pacearchaeota archaeon]|nr:B12-binding domain-containing radical SAM protein [Candidatus Pacearchaeota archaeon]